MIETQQDLEGIKRIGQLCGLTLQHMLKHVEAGITTAELDRIGAEFLRKHNAASAPITAYQFPGWTCISVNEEAAHGIPSARVIKAGDVVNIDVSAVLEGYWADTGASILVAPMNTTHKRLLENTKEALYKGIAQAKVGARVYEISRAIEGVAKRERYSILRELSGHGVGRHIHEEPTVPNYFARQYDDVLKEGMVLTIEPFFNLGRGRIKTAKDGWTLYTTDRSITAQFEHTVVVQGDTPLAVTKVDGGH
jgi:methionyl aminopeptidase